MNHMPAHMQDAFNRIFKPREWHSEAERQEVIGKIAKDNERDINLTLLANAKDMRDIAEEMYDQISVENMEIILRCLESGEATAMLVIRRILMDAKKKCVAEVAEYRAIRYVEEKGPAVLDR